MSIFSKKYRYTIHADETTNYMVKGFAYEHSVRGKPSVIDDCRRGVYMVWFTSCIKPEDMSQMVENAFGQHCKVEHDSENENMFCVRSKDSNYVPTLRDF